MEYNDLIDEAYNENIEIIEIPFNNNVKGLYCDKVIGLNKKIDTITEKKCILAEELGHFYTSNGNIINNSIMCRKAETTARRWAYKKLITLNDFINAFNASINNKQDLADYLDVTISFLDETVSFYKKKYGIKKVLGNYIIFFEPSLALVKKF